MIELCGSILSANRAHIGRDIKTAEACGISRFHIDVFDGHYTPFIAFSDQLVRDLRKETDSVLDAHLSVYNIEAITETFLDSGIDILSIQFETCALPSRLMKRIRSAGISPGFCTIPATPFERMEYYIEEADYLNILGVEPGIGAQEFDPRVLDKIEKTADYIQKNGLDVIIAVDGGVNTGTMKSIMDAGADVLVLGSALFNGDIVENISGLKKEAGL